MLTPVEIRHFRLRRRPLGYGRRAVDTLLAEVVESFENVWRDRADLRDELDRLEAELTRYRELDVLLRNSLVAAERTADEVRARAGKEAGLIVEQARVRAREITAEAVAERDRIHAEVRRLRALEAELRADHRAFLLAALERVEAQPDTAERMRGSTLSFTSHKEVPEQAA